MRRFLLAKKLTMDTHIMDMAKDGNSQKAAGKGAMWTR
jgi:hypothetical protein